MGWRRYIRCASRSAHGGFIKQRIGFATALLGRELHIAARAAPAGCGRADLADGVRNCRVRTLPLTPVTRAPAALVHEDPGDCQDDDEEGR